MENAEKIDFQSYLDNIALIANSFSAELSACIGEVNHLDMHVKAAVLEEYLKELKADSDFDLRFYGALSAVLRQSSEVTMSYVLNIRPLRP